MKDREFRQNRMKCGQPITLSSGERGIFAGYTWDKYADRFKYCSVHLDNGNTIHKLNTSDLNIIHKLIAGDLKS